jgi:hypothetical protein
MLKETELVRKLVLQKDVLLQLVQKDRAKSVDKYVWIQKNVSSTSIQTEDFQRVWSDFYRLNNAKLSKEKKQGFYEVFAKYLANDVSYIELVSEMVSVTGKVESSFSSKILHTKNPNMPIIDSNVAKELGWDLPSKKPTQGTKIKATVQMVDRLSAYYANCFTKDGWAEVSEAFDAYLAVPEFEYTEVKKIDILLWQFYRTRLGD